MNDKQIKKEFQKKTSSNPDKYYATSVLKSEGFERKQCTNCKKFYWTTTQRTLCDDPACSGGFKFIDQTPVKEKISYIDIWKRFSKHFEKLGYTPINRYPVAARWRDDTDFVQASIYDFQPYVVSGEVEPPANPLVVPQFCLRFNDIDNVGITGAHYTGFVMIGQHAFMPPDKWKQSDYFNHIHSWLTKGLGLPLNEITYHEDAWAGGGNFGPCMEYFSRGLELGNQVYMQYEVTPSGNKELKLKVLDMGMGQERNAWFTGAAPTSYETTFPTVVKKLQEISGVKVDSKILQKFLPYSSYLNVDEVEDINKTWQFVASKVGVSSQELQKQIVPLSALYSVAEHSRSLLLALNDGVLPSNVAGGYNLRVILRRAFSFIEKYKWDIEMAKLIEMHAQYLKPQYPELVENTDEIAQILEVERKKYKETLKRTKGIVKQLISSGKEINDDKLIELYDSSGINPDQIKDAAKEEGREVKVPDNFYALVAERHEQVEQKVQSTRKEKYDVEGVAPTKALYYDDYEHVEFEANVLKIIDNKVLLDKTYFFATSGGQEHDTGHINGEEVIDVIRQGNHILHIMKNKPKFKQGDKIEGKIDFARRKQLTQHHTATHILNAVSRRNLGTHAWQSGTGKFVDKARLDMTHYEILDDKQMKEFEKQANEIVEEDAKVNTRFEPRTEAEQKYGFSLYQGGIVPGKKLRLVEIVGHDIEACGGTHVHHTKEVGKIKLINCKKVQDGLVRLEYVAGEALNRINESKNKLASELAKVLECEENQIPSRSTELFDKWKKAVKKKKKLDSYELTSINTFSGDVIKEASKIFNTQPEHLVKTAKRFKDELLKAKNG